MNSSRYGYYHQPPRQHTYTDVYYGLRIGGSFATVSSDDPYLDGGSLRAGLNIGAVIGLQVAPQAPIYFETGLSYIEKAVRATTMGLNSRMTLTIWKCLLC